MERVLREWKEILQQHPGDPEARTNHDEVAAMVVSRASRRELARSFDAKVDFIRDRGDLRETESRVLKKLHRYRNELYHRDRLRPETVRSASLLYFDITCALFERLPQYPITTLSAHKEVPPALRKFSAREGAKGYPTEQQIAASLRADLGIDDAGLKEILATHLTSRLDDLDESISRAQKLLFGAIAEAAPAGPWKQAIVYLAQWENEGLPETIEELLAVHAPYSEADLTAWRQQVAGIEEAGDRLELFAAFADIEDAFPLTADRRWRARTGIAAQSWRDHGRWRVREFLDYQASYYRAARHGKPYSQVPGRDLAGTWPDNIGAGEN